MAGGTVGAMNAGVAGRIGAVLVGKGVGVGKEAMKPHNLTMTMIGASLLWVGWFGFNAGSALEAGNSAALAFINTFLATACAVLTWTFGEWMFKGKPSMLGAASGAGAGLGAVAPAAGRARAWCRRRAQQRDRARRAEAAPVGAARIGRHGEGA